MFLAKREKCSFVVYTKCDLKVMSVDLDCELMTKEVIPKVRDFYIRYYMPVIFRHEFGIL